MKKIVPDDAVLVPEMAKRVFEGVIFDVYQWPQEMFDGTSETFEMLKRPDTIEVLAIVDDKIVVLDEEQPHAGRRMNLPAGRADPTDSSPMAAAQRELHEETGLTMANWRLLMVKQPYIKAEWFIYTFLAWGKSAQDEPHQDAGEKIKVQYIPFTKLKQLSIKGTDYLGEVLDLIEPVKTLEELLNLPEFTGKEVDR